MYRCVVLCVASKCYKASNMCVLNPHVHVLGDDSAVIAYTTLTQHLDKSVINLHTYRNVVKSLKNVLKLQSLV